MLRISRETACERGQAMVESVLILLMVIVILVGIIDLGQILFIHQGLVERARSAVRYGVVHAWDATTSPTGITNVALYNQPFAPTESSGGFFGLTPQMVSVVRDNAGTTNDRITVTITSYPYRFLSPYIAGALTARPIVASLPMEAE